MKILNYDANMLKNLTFRMIQLAPFQCSRLITSPLDRVPETIGCISETIPPYQFQKIIRK